MRLRIVAEYGSGFNYRRVALFRGFAAIAGLAVLIAVGCGDDQVTEPLPVPPPTPTTITLDRSSLSFDAITASQQLNATVQDQNGNAMHVSATWSSSDDQVASVSSSGMVTAERNGTASIRASHSGLNATANVTVQQTFHSYEDVVGDGQTTVVTQTLPDSFGFTIFDRLGNPIEGMEIHFENLAEGTVLAPHPAVTDASGRVRSEWTLGRRAGIQSADARTDQTSGLYSFHANGLPDVVDSLVKIGGDSQMGLPATLLYTPLYVATTDRFGNPVPGQQVDFVVTTGGGTIAPASLVTDEYGTNTAWTLGDLLGAQSAEARAPGLKGSPAVFTARAVVPSIARVEPDTIRERYSATVYGTDFIIGETLPIVDGMATFPTEWTDTSITFEVPEFDCRPTRSADIWLWTLGRHSDTLSHMLQPTSMVYEYGYPQASLGIEVGEQLLIREPQGYCLQFAPSDGEEEYLFGIEVALEDPGITAPFVIKSETGSSPSPNAGMNTDLSVYAAPSSSIVSDARLARRRLRNEAELLLRLYERDRQLSLSRLSQAIPVNSAGGADATSMLPRLPAVGQSIAINVPDLNESDPCASYITVEAVVKHIGEVGVFLTDAANPAADSIIDAELHAYSDTLDGFIHPIDTTYFGPLSDLDDNGRSYILFSIEVNKLLDGSIGGFTFAGDLRSDPAACAGTNGGEIIYAEVPDPTNEAGTVVRSRGDVLFELPKTLTHEYTHLIQNGYWMEGGFGSRLTLWEAEGHASLAEEVVGHAILGNSTGQDYDASVALGTNGAGWYDGLFADLATYYGWDGASGRFDGAPENCSVFGPPPEGGTAACDPAWSPGTAWSFMRYLSDRFGPSWPGGEAALNLAVMRQTSSHGSDNISYVMPVGFPDILAGWAAMHYADSLLAGVSDSLTMTSWDLSPIMATLGSGAQLAPSTFGFTNFEELRVVRGGGTSYTVLSSAGPHSALAVKIRHQNGIDAAYDLRPMLWVVRTR